MCRWHYTCALESTNKKNSQKTYKKYKFYPPFWSWATADFVPHCYLSLLAYYFALSVNEVQTCTNQCETFYSTLSLESLALFPGLPCFHFPFAFTTIHRSGRVSKEWEGLEAFIMWITSGGQRRMWGKGSPIANKISSKDYIHSKLKQTSNSLIL